MTGMLAGLTAPFEPLAAAELAAIATAGTPRGPSAVSSAAGDP
jgi:hypothetical protein